jgi:hypothetical protein
MKKEIKISIKNHKQVEEKIKELGATFLGERGCY